MIRPFSFSGFKKIDHGKRFGPAGGGYDYHHIVEQSASGDIPENELNRQQISFESQGFCMRRSARNIHDGSFEYDGSLRASLNGASFEDRRDAGINVMQETRISKETDFDAITELKQQSEALVEKFKQESLVILLCL